MNLTRLTFRLILYLSAAGMLGLGAALLLGGSGARATLAFASNHIIGQTRLYLMDVPRRALIRLSNLPTNGGLQWSPDGEWLAFEDAVEGAYYRVRPWDGRVMALTPLDGFSYGLTWLPDGQSIVYARNRWGAGTSGVFLDRLDGSASTQLSPQVFFPGVMLRPLAGGRLLYTASAENALGQLIYSLEADGRSRLVVDTGRYVDDLALAPNGRHLAYTQAQRDGYYELGLVDLTCLDTEVGCAGGARLLTQNAVRDQGPVWSPDGERIAYRQIERGQMHIRLLTLATGESVEVTTPANTYDNLQWSPDGDWLSFTSKRGGLPGIYALDLACLKRSAGCLGAARLLLTNSFIAASPVWQPGG
jgi:Tol biopolymer transport system component